MITATITDSGSATATFYAYDVSGIRQSEITGGITRDYLVDTNRDYAQVIEEADVYYRPTGSRRGYVSGISIRNYADACLAGERARWPLRLQINSHDNSQIVKISIAPPPRRAAGADGGVTGGVSGGSDT